MNTKYTSPCDECELSADVSNCVNCAHMPMHDEIEPTVVWMGGQFVDKTCEICSTTATYDKEVRPWICECGHDVGESIHPVGTMVEYVHCHQQCDYHTAYQYGGTCSNCRKQLPKPVASLPSKSQSKQLNPFPAKPTTPPPAHYFAREREEPKPTMDEPAPTENTSDELERYLIDVLGWKLKSPPLPSKNELEGDQFADGRSEFTKS